LFARIPVNITACFEHGAATDASEAAIAHALGLIPSPDDRTILSTIILSTEGTEMNPKIHRRIRVSLRGWTTFLLASLLFVACGGIVADSSGTAQQAVGLLTISGTVTDGSGFAVFGSRVTLNGSAHAVAAVDGFSGKYTFSVNPGSYSVTPSGGCLSFAPDVVNVNNLSANTTVNFVGSGNNAITNCEPNPNPGATSGSLTISGHVTSAGHAVPGAKIALNGSTQGVRITDELGAYSFSVNPGSYSLNSSGGGCASIAPSVLNLNGLTTSQTRDFAGTGCPPAALAMCSELNTLFTGQSGGPACASVTTTNCPDVTGTWDFAITLDAVNTVFADCRFGQWFGGLLSNDDLNNWFSQVTLFTMQFFGCPFVGTLTGPLSFAMIPAPLQSRVFTTADLSALSAAYAAAIAQAISDNGSPPLTAAQTSAINAQLAFLASKVPGTVTSSHFTFSTCAADAGGN
jgi:hypothetical protein